MLKQNNYYDVVIIGAGMSGLAAGIRLAYYDKKVLICEQHGVLGGLNSYYQKGWKTSGCGSSRHDKLCFKKRTSGSFK